MQVIVKRQFISQHKGIGNRKAGDVLTVDDAYGNHLIKNGLVAEVKAVNPVVNQAQSGVQAPGFQCPVVEAKVSGPSLPADQALPKTTAKMSKSGASVKRKKSAGSR